MILRRLLLVFLLFAFPAIAQQFEFPPAARVDEAALAKSMPELARKVLPGYAAVAPGQPADMRLLLQILASDHAGALATIDALRATRRVADPLFGGVAFTQYEVFVRARILQAARKEFDAAYREAFRNAFDPMEDKLALQASIAFGASLAGFEADLKKAMDTLGNKAELSQSDALNLLRRYALTHVYRQAHPLGPELLAADDARRYDIQDDVLIKTPGGFTLSAVVARKKGVTTPQPAALFFFIYANLAASRDEAKQAAARGYVGVAVDTRGKRLSLDPILPYEHEAEDVHDAIDWIARQPWSDGRVAMYGGSYTGFAQWAATKKMHPALKTIVPYAAAIPAFGVPMENNIFLNANYGWAFYVGNGKYLDDAVYNDRDRWDALNGKWYASGRPYREIDSVDGTPNPLLQRWLKHPSFDAYWQAMIPWRQDYARIDIPVLSITGYYDDGQISALQYFKEHYKYNPRANHYLLIGPYDHRGAQGRPAAVLRGYTIDPVAHINVREITFQWLDHVLRGGPRPELIKDRVNYQVMGANAWRHAPSIEKMRGETLKLYLTDRIAKPVANVNADVNTASLKHHALAGAKPAKPGFLTQTVDLTDRKTTHNDYYPFPVVGKEPDLSNGFTFISEPFAESVSVDGVLTGQINLTLNKKDLDIGIVLYEVMPDGKLFHLTYFLGRASYARDMTRRHLLTPGRKASIPFERVRMVSRQLSKGSRLLVTLNVNVNPYAQINYGTGKDVSDESIADAKTPLRVQWHNDSFVEIPLRR